MNRKSGKISVLTLAASLFLITGIASVAFLSGCSKKSEVSSGGAGLTDNALLSRIPVSSVAFMVWDAQGEAFKKYKASPWSGAAGTDVLKLLEPGPASGDNKAFSAIMKSLSTAGLISSDPNQPGAVGQAVGFIALEPQKKIPDAGLFLSATEQGSFDGKVGAIETVLKGEGITVSKQTIQGLDGLSFAVGEVAGGAPAIKTFYLAANKKFMGLASDQALLGRLFTEKVDNGTSRIVASPEFVRVKSALPSSANQILLGYVDVAQIIKLVPQFVPAAADDPNLKQVPVDAALISVSMQEAPESMILVSTTARTDDQKRWLSAFDGAGSPGVFKAAPSSTVIHIGLDGKLISSIKNAALGELSADEQSMLKPQLAALDSLTSLGIGILSSSATSPFPGVLLTFETSNASTLLETLKTQLGGAVAMSGMPLGDWQTKQLDGANVNYIQSPMMGLGVFLTSANNTLIVGSSEDAVHEALSAAKNSSTSLASTMPVQAKNIVGDSKTMLAAYGNFDRIATTVESVQGNLAAFTGGASGLDATQVENLKKMGSFALAMNFEDGLFKLKSGYASNPVK